MSKKIPKTVRIGENENNFIRSISQQLDIQEGPLLRALIKESIENLKNNGSTINIGTLNININQYPIKNNWDNNIIDADYR